MSKEIKVFLETEDGHKVGQVDEQGNLQPIVISGVLESDFCPCCKRLLTHSEECIIGKYENKNH